MSNLLTACCLFLKIFTHIRQNYVKCYSTPDNQATALSSMTGDETRRLLSKLLAANKNVKSTSNNQMLTIPITSSEDLQQVEFEKLPVSSINRDSLNFDLQHSSCQLVQIVHLLHHNGCQPKAIESFACTGSCPSYVQMSSSKFWQYERSCSCCQQTGLQEATFTLDCPSLDPPFKKVKTYAPVDCICRACTDLGKENLQPQELIEALAGEVANIANNSKLQ